MTIAGNVVPRPVNSPLPIFPRQNRVRYGWEMVEWRYKLINFQTILSNLSLIGKKNS